jgi:TatA/E family protein of Tat protein translocase
MPSLQLPELLVIGFLFIVFFGRGKLGSTFQELGGAINQFKKGMNEAEAIKADINSSVVEASKVESKPVEVKLQAVAE